MENLLIIKLEQEFTQKIHYVNLMFFNQTGVKTKCQQVRYSEEDTVRVHKHFRS